ncbi:MAG: Npt1/Npt2 family nucleotide transporter [Cryomorphaceae bacterium]
MKSIVNKFYDIRAGEWKIVSAFFAMSFLLIVIVYFLKPARDSLFLVQLGAERLPYVFIAIAILAIPVTSIVIRTTQKHKSRKVFPASVLAVIAQLLVLRLLLETGQQWVYVLFYLWVGIFGILVISQFWLFANEAFDAAQSKRVFPLLNFGAIMGSVLGSHATSAVVSAGWVSTENLLYVGIGALALVFAIAVYIRGDTKKAAPRTNAKKKKRLPLISGVKGIIHSKYQLMIAGIIGSAMLVSTLADYQVKAAAELSFPDKESLTSFFGLFYGLVSLAALLIQITLSGPLLKKIGLGVALSIRPAGILIAAVLVAIEPVLAFVVIMGGTDSAARYSVDKTSREILFLPISQNIKNRIKLLMDVIVDRFSKGFAGFVLLVLVVFLDFTIPQVAVVTAIASGIWLALSYRAQRAYVDEFRTVLHEHDLDIANESLFDFSETQTQRIIKEQLEGDSNQGILRTLKIIKDSAPEPFAPSLQKFLTHPTEEIRYRALNLLSRITTKNFSEDVLPLLNDDAVEIKINAMDYISIHEPNRAEEILKDWFKSGSSVEKTVALACSFKYENRSALKTREKEALEEIIGDETDANANARAQIAGALVYLNEKTAVKYLTQLFENSSGKVKKATIKSMGIVQSTNFIPLLVEMLEKSAFKTEALHAIANYPEKHLPEIAEYIPGAVDNYGIYRSLVKAISNISSQSAANELLSLLEKETNAKRRYALIKGINRLHANNSELSFSQKRIDRELEREIEHIYLFKHVLNQLTSEERFDLLKKVINERIDQRIEHAFRLLGMKFHYRDLRGALQSYRSVNAAHRSAAIEFIDNLLEGKTSKQMMPLIDKQSTKIVLATGEKYFGVKVKNYEEAMVLLLEQDDEWLKAATLYGITPSCPAPLPEMLLDALNDKSEIVRETAELIYKNKFQKSDEHHH